MCVREGDRVAERTKRVSASRLRSAIIMCVREGDLCVVISLLGKEIYVW